MKVNRCDILECKGRPHIIWTVRLAKTGKKFRGHPVYLCKDHRGQAEYYLLPLFIQMKTTQERK